MKRITDKSSAQLNCNSCFNKCAICDITTCVDAAIIRLQQIENILGDDYDLNKLKQLVDLDKGGN